MNGISWNILKNMGFFIWVICKIPKLGVPPVLIHFTDFHYKSTTYWGITIYGKPHLWLKFMDTPQITVPII